MVKMRKYWLLLVGTLLLLISCGKKDNNGCSVNEHRTNIYEYLDSTYELRKLNYREVNEGGVSGGFFLGIGGISDNSHEVSKIRMSWKTPNETYSISEFEIEKVRVKFDSTVTTPYISFNFWKGECMSFDDLKINSKYYFYDVISYVTIHCKEEDYTIDVDVNQVK